MPRVIGIDPGTTSVDLCGLDDGGVFLDRTIPTRDALADPSTLLALLESAAPLDLVAGPSGYGLPLVSARDLVERDVRLACLAARGESGGIGGLGGLLRALGGAQAPVVLTPGVVHLDTVPAHRKVNKVDMGTADKVCVAALAIREQADRLGCSEREVSFVQLEIGSAFTAALAVEGGRIVDGLGGSSGPMGARASGALDAEVAYLAGHVTKAHVFAGGALDVAGTPDAPVDRLATADSPRGRLAWQAWIESAVKAVAALAVSVPAPREVILSGRLAGVPEVRRALEAGIGAVLPRSPVIALAGFARVSKHAAQGAALLADGLAGGRSRALVDVMGLRRARGSVLDHLYVIEPATARARLGLD